MKRSEIDIMKNFPKLFGASALLSLLGAVPVLAQDSALAEHQGTIENYCYECHNFVDFSGGLALDILDLDNLGEDAEDWEHVITKLRGHLMPPVGQPRPDEETYDSLAGWLESELDTIAMEDPNPGRPGLYRLNRTEYATVIRDILGMEVSSDIEATLPPDNSSYGFDNIADILGVSPTLLEGYLAAADRISAIAVGDPEFPPEQVQYPASMALSQNQHIDGLPFGTRGGMAIEHNFPLDGVYEINTSFLSSSLDALMGLQFPHQFEVAIDGQRVKLVTIGGPADYTGVLENSAEILEEINKRTQVRIPLTAGVHKVTVTFLAKSNALDMDQLEPFERGHFDAVYIGGNPAVTNVEIAGPFNGAAPSRMTATRQKIFTCYPNSVADEAACAEQIFANLATQTYRRPVSDQDVDTLMDFFQAGRENKGTFDGGIQMGLRRMLMEPDFLFRFEEEPSDLQPGENFQISDMALASRLSFFLWSSVPDEELISLAEQGLLSDPRVLDEQVIRMLEDPKANALVENFAGQWLQLRNLDSRAPDFVAFPDFDENLRNAFLQETSLFFESVMREDRNVVDLMTADYTYINERLALHYGIDGIYGDHFRRVSTEEYPERGGLLGQGSILTVTSFPHRTSPVVRGKWVLDNILGAEPADPPDNVPALDENAADAVDIRSMRERLADHRADPACSSCHNVMDPIGLAMEKYDGIGRWRELDEGGLPIDSSGSMADGTAISGPIALKEALIAEEDMFVNTFVNRMLTYAIGRGLEYYDKPTVRAIARNAGEENYRFSAIVQEVAKSLPFQWKRAAEEGTEQLAASTSN
ncbi:MAG: hypothetical protein CMP91_12110 [Gammaproteobacteria bacterium]|nr:hypothetical protein [Gammaproteobacteria bacterium]|tara:strand:- start:194633 stop:197083 length:2451 start_codon:yes stop_codon:yes gene_type:complete